MERKRNHRAQRVVWPPARIAVFKKGVVVRVNCRVGRFSSCQGLIGRLARTVLQEEGVVNAHLSIQLVDNAFIRKLNLVFKRRKRATDVLSFDLNPAPVKGFIFADVVVSVDMAKKTARRLKIDPTEEVFRYVIHGILHLLGYDDATSRDKAEMWRRQEDLLRDFLTKSAYVHI